MAQIADLHQVVYISRSIKLLSEQELLFLLNNARKKNASLDITGMLLYKDRSFIQLIEGEERHVDALFDTISKDTRHMRVKKIIDEGIVQRTFNRWSMGFQNLTHSSTPLPEGYISFLDNLEINSLQINRKIISLFDYFKAAS